MVRKYEDKELLDRVKSLVNYQYIPHDYWAIAVRSNEDITDEFDDKIYLYRGEQFVMVTSCTTNKGLKGTAVMKADVWNYDAYKYGLHKQKMKALRQVKGIPYYRDRDFDGKTDASGTEYRDIIYMNIHGATYNEGSKKITQKIGGWSEGCIVLNRNEDYEKFIALAKNQPTFTLCLINEF
jgi:hypothetical protein